MERKVVRISLDMPFLLRSVTKVAASHHTKSMRSYIIEALMERLARENISGYQDMANILTKIKKEEKFLSDSDF